MKFFVVVILAALSVLDLAESANILCILPIASKSHKRVFEPLANALAGRNHTVTIISPYKPSKETKNIREIVVDTSGFQEFSNPLEIRAAGAWGLMARNFDFIYQDSRKVYRDERIKKLVHEKFDLIILDAFVNDAFYGLIYKLGAPVILLAPQAVPSALTEIMGNTMPSSFVPVGMFPFTDEMTFRQRVENFLFNMFATQLAPLLGAHKYSDVYREELGDPDIPPVAELSRKVSMLFSNSHFTQTFSRPLMPDTVEVGGMHCVPAKPLPKHLEEFVAGAEHGFIVFSLGSIVQGNQMPDRIRQVFMNVFSRLKERVVWKWETEDMADLPANVKLTKWIPQQDLLGHPNIKIFMTHGGLLSTQEALYHGVPVIGIPIFADQNLNMLNAELSGYGRTVEILNVTEASLEATVREVLSNKRYAERSKELSRIFRDQTESPLERAVFWSEYVMRHKGAPQLRSAARKLNTIQRQSLDVVAFLGAVILTVLWILKLIIVKLCRCLLCRTKKDSVKKNQ